MSVTLYGNSFGYRPEQAEFADLSRVVVAQKFRKLADEGFANNQESHVSVIEELQNEGYEFDKLSPAVLADVDRKFDRVGLNRKQVIQELELNIARFRENFRPSSIPRPGRNNFS